MTYHRIFKVDPCAIQQGLPVFPFYFLNVMTRKVKVCVVGICASQCIFIEQHFLGSFHLFLYGIELGISRVSFLVASPCLPLDLPSVSLCPFTDSAVELKRAQCGTRLASLKSRLCLSLAVWFGVSFCISLCLSFLIC